VIDAEQVQHGGVEVVNMNRILGDVVSEIVRRAISHAAFAAAASHQ
jgi:hypothetical protein